MFVETKWLDTRQTGILQEELYTRQRHIGTRAGDVESIKGIWRPNPGNVADGYIARGIRYTASANRDVDTTICCGHRTQYL